MSRRRLARAAPATQPVAALSGTHGVGTRNVRWMVTAVAIILLLTPLPAAQASQPAALPPADAIQLTPSLPSSQPIGTVITWTATATDTVPLVYRFSVSASLAHGPFTVVRDYSPHNTFRWTAYQGATYYIQVTVQEGYTGTATVSKTVAFVLTARASTMPRVHYTGNPLVALYSAPGCVAGDIHVAFRAIGAAAWSNTGTQPCLGNPSPSRNFLVAGMTPRTTYQLVSVVVSGTATMTSSTLSFTTGGLPAGLIIPRFSVPVPPGPQTSTADGLILHMLYTTSNTEVTPVATNLQGQVSWYAWQPDLSQVWALRYQPLNGPFGSAIYLTGNDGQQANVDDVLRRVDLAGVPLQETNIQAVNQQLALMGKQSIYGFHHDALVLPNGDVATFGYTQRVITTTPVLGDMVLVLDKNLQVVWAWDAFDHLDPNRGPTLGETCAPPTPPVLCPGPTGYNPNTIDWLHANSIDFTSSDNDLIVSLRNQDWVIKINYDNAAGDGAILWTMGPQGDFTLVPSNPTDPYPWFSHQHNPNYALPGQMVVFDNGNTRCASAPPPCDSRGQVYTVNEQTKVMTQTASIDLGNYSAALGTAQLLTNENLNFESGFQFSPQPVAQQIEVTADGTTVYVQQVNQAVYRSWRLQSLFASLSPGCTTCF